MIVVRLLGKLGQIFGRYYAFDIRSPAEAMQALSANFPDFTAYLQKSLDAGIEYRAVRGTQDLAPEQLYQKCDEIKIVPVVSGSGGIGRILLGAALIATSAFMPASIGVFGVAISSSTVGLLGGALLLSGVSRLLSPRVNRGDPNSDRQTSFIFNGPVNTTAQGNAIAVCYGKMLVGSQVISAGISVSQIA